MKCVTSSSVGYLTKICFPLSFLTLVMGKNEFCCNPSSLFVLIFFLLFHILLLDFISCAMISNSCYVILHFVPTQRNGRNFPFVPHTLIYTWSIPFIWVWIKVQAFGLDASMVWVLSHGPKWDLGCVPSLSFHCEFTSINYNIIKMDTIKNFIDDHCRLNIHKFGDI